VRVSEITKEAVGMSAPVPAERPIDLRPLYRLGGVAALLSVALTVGQTVVFLGWGPPGFLPTAANVIEWFARFEANTPVALLDLDLLMVPLYVGLVFVYLAMGAALRKSELVLGVAATTVALVAITLYLATSPALAMLSLSNAYAGAKTEAERTSLVAAGQATLAAFQGTPGATSYVLMGVAGILVSANMLRQRVFSRATGSLGVAQGVLMLVPSTFGTVGLLLSLVSLVPFVAWFSLVGRRLLELARNPP
jgi:hypothetical protein